MTRVSLVKLASYGMTMAVGTGLDVTCVTVLRHAAGVPLGVAVAGGFLSNVASGYVLSRSFVFRSATHRHRTSGPRYLALVLLNVLVAIPGVTIVVAAGAPYLLARVLSSGLLVPTNYLVMRHWVFPSVATQGGASAF